MLNRISLPNLRLPQIQFSYGKLLTGWLYFEAVWSQFNVARGSSGPSFWFIKTWYGPSMLLSHQLPRYYLTAWLIPLILVTIYHRDKNRSLTWLIAGWFLGLIFLFFFTPFPKG